MSNYYDVLGVSRRAEEVVIRAAYRALMSRYHPDAFKDDPTRAERMAKLINEAYATLRDPGRRAAYDSKLDAAEADAAVQGRGNGEQANGRPPPPPPPSPKHPFKAVYGSQTLAEQRGLRHVWLAVAAPLAATFFLSQGEPMTAAPAEASAPSIEQPGASAAAYQARAEALVNRYGIGLLDLALRIDALRKSGLSLNEAYSALEAELAARAPGGDGAGNEVRAVDGGGAIEMAGLPSSSLPRAIQPAAIAPAPEPLGAASSLLPSPQNARPDLSRVSSEDRYTIEIACAGETGIVAKNGCLRSQLASLTSGNPRPDLSRMSSEDRYTVEIACAGEAGVVEKNSCLRAQAKSWTRENRRPDLSRVSPEDRYTIEIACAGETGLVAKNSCLRSELRALLSN